MRGDKRKTKLSTCFLASEAGRISSNSSVLQIQFKILVSFQVRKQDSSAEVVPALIKSVNTGNKQLQKEKSLNIERNDPVHHHFHFTENFEFLFITLIV